MLNRVRHLSPRQRKLIAALIASAVTTFIALHAPAMSQEDDDTCSREDVAVWHLRLLDPATQLSASDILETTQAFLGACPNRPEVSQAYAIAGMASVEIGDPDAAIGYFDQAGTLFTTRQKLYRTASLLALGRDSDAWAARDTLISDWLGAVAAQPGIDMVVERMDAGRLVRLGFASEDRLDGLLHAWIALPDGPGWPAALTIGAQREGLGLKPARSELDEDQTAYVDLYRCRTRRMLAAVRTDALAMALNDSAEAALRAYLNEPDLPSEPAGGTGIELCLWPDRLLPAPRG